MDEAIVDLLKLERVLRRQHEALGHVHEDALRHGSRRPVVELQLVQAQRQLELLDVPGILQLA